MSSLLALLFDLIVGSNAEAARRRKEKEAIRQAKIDAAEKALREEFQQDAERRK